MALPVIAGKLFVPKLRRGLVQRPRLSGLLRQGAESRLTLLSAPAGFGKTTLLAQWLEETAGRGGRVAWLALDAADKDPAAFWAGVVTALQAAVPGLGTTAQKLLANSPAPIDQVITTVLNELAADPKGVWLVLEDYHLAGSREVGEGMTFLLEHLPPRVHVVVSTRADPDLPLSRWRVRGELVEVRAAQLRFTPEETAAYFQATAGLELSAEQVTALEQRTEGWVAALQLAALSLRGRTDPAGFIARFAGDNRYVLDYLVEEVLAHQSDTVRGFLLQSAVLDRLTGPLCDAVTGSDDGHNMLLALERANLFTVPLDDRREWYRYHHLFADVLRARLLSEQPEQIPLLHQRASRWCESHGLVAEAVGHALAARDFERAAHLMELAAPAIRRKRQDAVMRGWLQELPDGVIRRSPVLSVFCAFMLMASGDLDGAESRLADAELAMAAAPDGPASPWADVAEFQTLPATIAIYRASLAQARGDVAGTTMYAQLALELAGPRDHLARGAAAGFLGLAAWAAGDVPAALATFTEAVACLRAAGNRLDELSSTVVLADLWLAAGRPGRARKLMHGALKLAEAEGGPMARAAAELHVGLAEIDCAGADPGSARHHLDAAEALLAGAPMAESRFRWFVAKGLLAQAEGEPEGAIELLEQAEQLYRPGFFPDVRPIAAMKARIWIAQGRLEEASGWARGRGLSAADAAGHLREFDHLTLVRLLLAQHRAVQQHGSPDAGAAGQAVPLLDRLLKGAVAGGRAGSLVEIRMLQALVHDARGHRGQALEELCRAFAEAPEPAAYVRLFLDEGAAMMELLRGAADSAAQNSAARGHARRLLNAGTPVSTPAQGAGAGQRQGPPSSIEPLRSIEPLSERELQVLKLLGGELSGPQIAGELFITYNTLRTHTRHIFTKLDVTDRRNAVRRAREGGLM